MKEVNNFSQKQKPDASNLRGDATHGHRRVVRVDLGACGKDREEQLSRAQDVFQRHESIQRSFIEMALGEDQEFDQYMERILDDLRALSERYRQDIPDHAHRQKDVADLFGMRNELSELSRNLETEYEHINRGIRERRKLRSAQEEHQQLLREEAERRSFKGIIKNAFRFTQAQAPISGKRGKEVVLTIERDEQEDLLERVRNRKQHLADVMNVVDQGIAFVRSIK